MKKLLIIKTGDTWAHVEEKYGRFEDMIARKAGVPACDVVVAPVYEKGVMPALDDVSAIVITGSHSMVSDRDPWSVSLSAWLKAIEPQGLPTLGICFGHQILADALGGVVNYHPQGIEIGTADIELTAEGRQDPLLGCLPARFLGQVAHSQTVLKLPDGARLLARGNFEPHHAFAYGDHIWGVQFHPEMEAGTMRLYIEGMEEWLVNDQGRDLAKLYGSLRENDFGKTLLHRFIELVG